jgi:GNAT superfamily N-acetyltransferase
MIQAPAVELAPIETERFGVVVARSRLNAPAMLDEVLDYCFRNRVAMLIGRVPTASLSTVHALEGAGFQLMDTLVRYEIAVDPTHPPTVSPLVRRLRAGEDEEVERIARASFSAYFGHYHADPRLNRAACDEAYVSWARRCCASGLPSEVMLVAESSGRIEAFAAIRSMQGSGELSLGAVAPEARGRGLYQALTLAGISWAGAQGAKRFHADTQIQNRAAQRSWVRAGLHPASATYTFHKWFV